MSPSVPLIFLFTEICGRKDDENESRPKLKSIRTRARVGKDWRHSSVEKCATRQSALRWDLDESGIQDPLENQLKSVYAQQNKHTGLNITLQLWICSFGTSLPLLCSALTSSWSFSALPRSPNIKIHWRLMSHTASIVLYVFPVCDFICMRPWNAATIFLPLTLPPQRSWGPTGEGCCRRLFETLLETLGMSVSRTLLHLSLSWQQPNRMQQCCFFPHARPHVSWPTSEEHLVTQIRPEGLCTACWWGGTWSDVQGLSVGVGFFSARSSSAETDTSFVQHATWGTD